VQLYLDEVNKRRSNDAQTCNRLEKWNETSSRQISKWDKTQIISFRNKIIIFRFYCKLGHSPDSLSSKNAFYQYNVGG
jgi:hypothetical protein